MAAIEAMIGTPGDEVFEQIAQAAAMLNDDQHGKAEPDVASMIG